MDPPRTAATQRSATRRFHPLKQKSDKVFVFPLLENDPEEIVHKTDDENSVKKLGALPAEARLLVPITYTPNTAPTLHK